METMELEACQRSHVCLVAPTAVVLALVFCFSRLPRRASPGMEVASLSSRSATLDFRIENDYTLRDGAPARQYPWLDVSLVEPYRATTLSVLGGSIGDVQYTWDIGGLGSWLGNTVVVAFESPGFYDVHLSAADSSTGVHLSSTKKTVACRYVRREIRSLLVADREAFFDASKIIYTTSEEQGRRLFDHRFRNISYFVNLHNKLAGSADCDHLHDGLGFLTQHAALTYAYERSLQSVEPSVTVPYWDFTIEAHAVSASGNLSAWRASQVFADDWFGNAQPAERTVTSGRWAYTPVARASKQAVRNAYQLVRAPWNQNSIPFLTRANSTYGFSLSDVPDCGDHYEIMQHTEWLYFGLNIQYHAHGTVHAMIGGVWASDFKSHLDKIDYRSLPAAKVALEAFATQKNLWRASHLQCPGYCSPDTPSSDCRCSCPDLTTWLDEGRATGILQSVSPLFFDDNYLTNKKGRDVSEYLLRLFCNDFDDLTPTIGDALESASPLDISFYPTHPTVDRLFHWRRINGFSNFTCVCLLCPCRDCPVQVAK